jgi:hypothetical protein
MPTKISFSGCEPVVVEDDMMSAIDRLLSERGRPAKFQRFERSTDEPQEIWVNPLTVTYIEEYSLSQPFSGPD